MNESQPAKVCDFWFPETEADFGIDPRSLIDVGEFEEAILVESPNCPPPYLAISAGFMHTEEHGPLTRETFNEDVRNAARELSNLIQQKYQPFQPIRFHRRAQPAYGVAPFHFLGDDYPFDMLVMGTFERSIGFDYEGERRHAPGMKWFLTTKVTPNKQRDSDVYVGKDWGAAYDA